MRPCLDCGQPAPGTRCDACRLAHARGVERQRDRPTTTRRGYGSRWKRLSRQARRMQPWCSRCGTELDLTGDHVVALAAGGPRLPRIDSGGLDVLCRRCNAAKGARTWGNTRDGRPSVPRPQAESRLQTAPGGDAA